MKYVFTNHKDHSVYPAGIEVKPGESRELDSDQCPEFAPKIEPEAEQKPADDPLAGLLANPVKEVKPILDTLNTEQLTKLEQLEAAGQARKSLLEAIAEAKLKLAQAGNTGNDAPDVEAILANPVEQILPTLDGYSLEVLEAMGEAEQAKEDPRLELLTAISGRILNLQEHA